MLAGLLLLAPGGEAAAHGPCGCTFPALGAAGTRVTAGTTAIKVIFNPRRSDLGLAPRHLASAYAPDVPTTTLLSRPMRDPLPRARFRIPGAIPPGVYLVLIFDGGEGGSHNTWDLFHVTGPGPRGAAPTAAASAEQDANGAWWIAGAAGLLLGLAIGMMRRRAQASSA